MITVLFNVVNILLFLELFSFCCIQRKYDSINSSNNKKLVIWTLDLVALFFFAPKKKMLDIA